MFHRATVLLDSFVQKCLTRWRKSNAGKSKWTLMLCKARGNFRRTKEQLRLSARPFKSCRCVPFEANTVHAFASFDIVWVCALQFQNESLSMKLEDQISENEDWRNKYVFCVVFFFFCTQQFPQAVLLLNNQCFDSDTMQRATCVIC